MPAFAAESVKAFARDGRIEFDHWFAAFDRRVRAPGMIAPVLIKLCPGIRAGETFEAESLRREEEIADRVRRLHRWNNAELREARDVLRAENLRVLDAPARLALLCIR